MARTRQRTVSPRTAHWTPRRRTIRAPTPSARRVLHAGGSPKGGVPEAVALPRSVRGCRTRWRCERPGRAVRLGSESPEQPSGDHVHEDRDRQQDQGHLEKGLVGEARRSEVAEVVHDPRGERDPGREDGAWEDVDIADDHRDRDRLAQRPSESQDDPGDNPRPGRTEYGHPRRFPPGRPEAEGGLPVVPGDGEHRFPGDRRDGRDDHDRQDQGGRQDVVSER